MVRKIAFMVPAVMMMACASSTGEPVGSTSASSTDAQGCGAGEKGLTAASTDTHFYYECDGKHWVAQRCADNLAYDAYFRRCDFVIGPKENPSCHLGTCKTQGLRASSSDTTGFYECDGGCWTWQHCNPGTEASAYTDTQSVEHVLCCTIKGSGAPGGCY
jgi:chitin binding peritrophin-A-like protein with CBM14 domain